MADQAGTRDPLYNLVVIGASAGGVKALALLVATLPPNLPAPVVVAQHLNPAHLSQLGGILERRSALPVHILSDGAPQTLKDGVVYVVPANRHVDITDAQATLRANAQRGLKPSIDRLLSTAAHAYGERLIAVILTGSGSDGAAGARAVKSAGGTVIIENPATASYPSMPASLAPTTVDIIADINHIGPLLHDLITGQFMPLSLDTEDLLPALLRQIRAHTGMDITRYKRASILRRLQRRMAATGATSLASYLSYIERNPDEYSYLAASFLIKATGFFRDRELFKYLREQLVPDINAHARARARGHRDIHIWSAGCATGEEAYSLAILLREALGDDLDHIPVRIYATDIDAAAIAFARRGIYSRAAVASLPGEYQHRYFRAVEGGFAVTEELRRLVIFGEHDLGHQSPFPLIDLVLCRNVLIYFAEELRRRTLELFAFSLRDGGYLVLGQTESAELLAEYFTRVKSRPNVYRRQGERILVAPIRPGGQSYPQLGLLTPRDLYASGDIDSLAEGSQGRSSATAGVMVSSQPTLLAPLAESAQPPLPSSPSTARERLGALVLDLPVGIVVVDNHYDIQMINAIACRLLGIYRPALGEDLLHLVQRVPVQPLREALDAITRATPPSQAQPEVIQVVASNGESHSVHIMLYPATDTSPASDAAQSVFLVVSDGPIPDGEDTMPTQPAPPSATTLRASVPQAGSTAQNALQTEPPESVPPAVVLERLREEHTRLLTHVHMLESANLELLSANLEARQDEDELLSRHEELQANDEQIRILNEELQATNEEVETVNEELESTIEELNMTNSELLARSQELHQLAEQREALYLASEREQLRLWNVLAHLPEPVLVVDANGKPIVSNAAYTALLGAPENARAPEPTLLDLSGQALDDDNTPLAQVRRPQSFQMEFLLPVPGGSSRRFEARGQPIFDEAKSHIGGVVILHEVTGHDPGKH